MSRGIAHGYDMRRLLKYTCLRSIETPIRRRVLALFSLALLVLFGLGLAALSVARILERHSLPEQVSASIVAIVVLIVVPLLDIWASDLRVSIGKRWCSSRPVVRLLCWFMFFPVFSLYFLTGDEVSRAEQARNLVRR